MTYIFLTFTLLFTFFSFSANAACENFLRGLRVESEFSIGDPWKSTYFQIASDDLHARTTVMVDYAQCSTDDCKQKLGILENANWNHQLVKFTTDEQTCEKIWSYFILINGGGTSEMLSISQLTTVRVDSTYPF